MKIHVEVILLLLVWSLLYISRATSPMNHCNRVVAGESWWETDLLAVAKEFLATVPAAADGKTGIAATSAVALPPLGVREWLVQEQVRSWLVAIFSRADPLRLMEVDLVMQIGKVRTYRMYAEWGRCALVLCSSSCRWHRVEC